jgi:PEP-CTERM motif
VANSVPEPTTLDMLLLGMLVMFAPDTQPLHELIRLRRVTEQDPF